MNKTLGLLAVSLLAAGCLSFNSAVLAKDFTVAVVDVPQVVTSSAQVQALKKEQQAKAEELVKFIENARKDVASITDSSKKKAAEENTEDTRNAIKEEPVNNMINNGVIERIAEKIFPSLKGKIDSEALIIVALIIILAKDGADMKLLVALGYLLI